MGIKRFEDLEVWQKSMELVNKLYALTGKSSFKDYSLRDQLRRAAVSIPSNIAEGFERGSNKEFIQFLFIAKGSASEARTQLYIALEQKYISKDDFTSAIELVTHISIMLKRFIDYLCKSSIKGEKFRLRN
ncbi:MAG: four helix bundle protein [Planctomycetes bacterium]|nr:four helix bundle protein [Planctomycetota bacterium]